MSTDSTLDNFAAVPPDDACAHYEMCGNRTPGGPETENVLCDACLDDVRYRESPLPDPRE